ncbi:ferritin, middle subunit-like [Salvelinus namaycush]|uniref:Ferritin n=1 Tax=Salvelinus namaycush TaxID=8040 RepID=A0A8U0U265_SALNM|nr:ferritin, middle subunit-like [Salvelinus namaycush]
MINMLMFSSYTYTSMVRRLQLATKGTIFLLYTVCMIMPDRDEWGNVLEAMQCALQLEKNVNQALLDLHKIASDKVDPHLCDFLETHYLNEQVEAIKKLGDHITNLTKMDAVKNKMAEYLFDKHTLGEQS